MRLPELHPKARMRQKELRRSGTWCRMYVYIQFSCVRHSVGKQSGMLTIRHGGLSTAAIDVSQSKQCSPLCSYGGTAVKDLPSQRANDTRLSRVHLLTSGEALWTNTSDMTS